ncbi:unnamed protein product, partial [Symbiodinium microadriaticum]
MKVKRSSSLPTAGAGWTRSELIGCIPVDSAYCGQTGNSADAFLVEHLRPRSRQGPVDRIGLADAFHRMNTSAEQAWYATETSTGGVKMMSVEDGYKVLFRKKKEGSNTALDEPKYVFDPLCRWIDAVRLRHFRDAIEQTCAGGRKKRMGRAMGPGPTRMVVYSAAFLQQSFAQHKVRWQACRNALQGFKTRREANAGKETRDASSKRKVCEILVSVLEDPGAFLMAWFTAGIMTRSTGFVPWLEVPCAKVVQKTDTTFFPMQMTVGAQYLQLCSAAAPCAALVARTLVFMGETGVHWEVTVRDGDLAQDPAKAFGPRPWSPAQAKAMAAQMCRSMMLQQRLIASLALQYEAKVLDAWGNHIPRSVRESATSIFFLPILLWKKIPLVEQMPYNWLRSLFQLRKYVSTQVKIFDWEAVDDLSDKDGVLALATQYVMLLRRWKKILRTPVANARFPVHEAGLALCAAMLNVNTVGQLGKMQDHVISGLVCRYLEPFGGKCRVYCLCGWPIGAFEISDLVALATMTIISTASGL